MTLIIGFTNPTDHSENAVLVAINGGFLNYVDSKPYSSNNNSPWCSSFDAALKLFHSNMDTFGEQHWVYVCEYKTNNVNPNIDITETNNTIKYTSPN